MIIIEQGTTINDIKRWFTIEAKEFEIETDSKSSFSINAEGFALSFITWCIENKKKIVCKLKLQADSIERNGIGNNSFLKSPFILALCLSKCKFYDRHERDVTNSIIKILQDELGKNNGYFYDSKSICFYAIDPINNHPPSLRISDKENDLPTESDFKDLIEEHVENSIIGVGSSKNKNALSSIEKSLNLYTFLKEAWENTLEHARKPYRSTRYISISRITSHTTKEKLESKYAQKISDYISTVTDELNCKIFILITVSDMGDGIVSSLRTNNNQSDKISTFSSAFREGVTSKKERNNIKRGLGLHQIIDSTIELSAFFVLTSSGMVAYKDGYKDKINNIGSGEIIDIGLGDRSKSTALSLVIPVLQK